MSIHPCDPIRLEVTSHLGDGKTIEIVTDPEFERTVEYQNLQDTDLPMEALGEKISYWLT